MLVDLVALVLAIPPVLAPRAAFAPLLLAIPIAWLLAWRWRGRALGVSALNPAILLLALMALVSLYATYSIPQSYPKIAGLVFGLAVYFAVVGNFRTRQIFYGLVTAYLLAGVGVAALGALGSNWLRKVPLLIAVTDRLPSIPFGLHGAGEGFHPNEVAGVLLWVAPLALASCIFILTDMLKIRTRIGSVRATILLIGTAFAALAIWGVLLLTQSRSGWIGAAVALLWAGTILLNRRLPLWGKWRAVFWVILAMLFVGGTVMFAPRILNEGALPTLEQAAGSAFSVGSLESRIEIWSRAIYGIEDFPLTGMGMNTFREVVHVLYPLFTLPPDIDFGHAHNHLLQAALDLGLPGLIAYLSLWFGAAWMLRSIWRRSEGREDRIWALGLGGGLLAYFVYGLTDAVALGAKPGFLWWYLLGLIAGIYQLQVSGIRYQEEQEPES
jgi:putative inorganic carbon (HCO3(-)) transporter